MLSSLDSTLTLTHYLQLTKPIVPLKPLNLFPPDLVWAPISCLDYCHNFLTGIPAVLSYEQNATDSAVALLQNTASHIILLDILSQVNLGSCIFRNATCGSDVHPS